MVLITKGRDDYLTKVMLSRKGNIVGSIQWKEIDSLICTNCNPPKEATFTLLRKMYERKQKIIDSLTEVSIINTE